MSVQSEHASTFIAGAVYAQDRLLGPADEHAVVVLSAENTSGVLIGTIGAAFFYLSR